MMIKQLWQCIKSWRTKRKRKRGCLSDLFEDDPRPSEQIVRDYRDGHEYLEPKPSNFGTILEWFDAQIAYHDRAQHCDSCAIKTDDLIPVPIAGIGVSYQCAKCAPVIKRYEKKYFDRDESDGE